MDKPEIPIAKETPASPRSTARAAGDIVKHGTADCSWGITPTASYGLVTDEDVDSKSIFEPMENQKGQVTGYVEYDGSKTLVLNIVAKATESAPAKGVVLTYNSVKYMITSAKRTASAKGKTKYVVTAEVGDNVTLA